MDCKLGNVILMATTILASCALTNEQANLGNSMAQIENKTEMHIWPEDALGIDTTISEELQPCGKRIANIHNPSVTIYKPQTPNGMSVIIAPGGGYHIVAFGLEGLPIARRLVKEGITVFILKYRLPTTEGVNFKHPIPLSDAERAIRFVRYHATSWGLDKNRIGLLGLSAGGHLAATAGTLFSAPGELGDEISQVSSRPDFLMLIYPVITTQNRKYAHPCPRTLLSKKSQPELLKLLSAELNVTRNTPPTYLAHAKDDNGVRYQNSQLFYDALKKCGVEAELKLYETGGHFTGFFDKSANADSFNWMEDLIPWIARCFGLSGT